MNGPYAAHMRIEALLPEPVEVARKVSPGAVNITLAWTRRQMLDFAALVRAQALEEAARVCEGFGPPAGAICNAIRAIAAIKPESGS